MAGKRELGPGGRADKVSQSYDVVVVGAGVIGTTTAWEIGRHGYRVALVDGGPPGGQASNAAAGILSPTAEAERPGPLWDLMLASFGQYPEMVRALESDSGMTVDFVRSGVLQLPDAGWDPAALAERFRWQSPSAAVEWVEASALGQVEPGLESPNGGAIFSPYEGQVHAPKMVQAALRAGRRHGVTAYFGHPVEHVLRDGDGRVVGVRTPERDIYADRGIVIATGAWSGLVGRFVGRNWPVFPIRGQILALVGDHSPVRRIVFVGHRYLVPKPDGRLIVGATEDRAGFDGRVTAAGLQTLTASFDAFGVGLGPLHFDRIWAGLRPATEDGLPVIGPLADRPEVFVASGHYRNGVLLTPVTANWALNWASGRFDAKAARAFRPDRWPLPEPTDSRLSG